MDDVVEGRTPFPALNITNPLYVRRTLISTSNSAALNTSCDIWLIGFSGSRESLRRSAKYCAWQNHSRSRLRDSIQLVQFTHMHEEASMVDLESRVESDHEVSLHYEITLANGRLLDSSYSRGAPYTYGPNEVVTGFHEVVEGSVVGRTYEKALRESVVNEMVPSTDSDATVKFTVLSSSKVVKDPNMLTWDEKFQEAADLKTQANDHFKKGSFTEATQLYEEALAFFKQVEDASDEVLERSMSIRLSLLLNVAFCMIRTENWLQAIIHSSNALAIDKDNTKALFRRGLARMHFLDLEAAERDLLQAARKEPLNAEIRRTLEECRGRIKVEDAKAAAQFSSIFA